MSEESSSLRRASIVGVAMAGDITCNYPLWIAAKRLAAGMPAFPSDIRSLYRGGGSLWLSLGPSTIVEDKVTDIVYARIDGPYRGIVSAASSGVCAALCVTSQVERLITASHTGGTSMGKTIADIYAKEGVSGLLLPPGMLAMVGREVPFASALFYFRPLLSQYLSEQFPIDQSKLSVSRELLCGCITSLVATPISHPPSVIAAYQQGHCVGPTEAVQQLLAQEGWRALFRGLAARSVSLAGTFTVVPILLHLFSKSNHPQ